MSSGDPSNDAVGEVIDKNALYGNFLKWNERQQELYEDAVRMALDVPSRPGSVSANRVNFINPPQFPSLDAPAKKGAGNLAKFAVGAALATGLGGLGLGAISLLKEPVVKEIPIPGENTEIEIKPGPMIFE